MNLLESLIAGFSALQKLETRESQDLEDILNWSQLDLRIVHWIMVNAWQI
jgi:hypothetical protein